MSAANSQTSDKTRVMIVGVLVAIVLVIIGLFLPPISLGQRLGLTGRSETIATNPTPANAPQEVALQLVNSAESVSIGSLSWSDFGADPQWATAAQTWPSDLNISGPVYTLSAATTPEGSVRITPQGATQPADQLDLFGWDGANWHFIASQVDGGQLVSTSGPLPRALAVAHANIVAPVVAVEVGGSDLPEELLAEANTIIVSGLTLAGDGGIEGTPAPTPGGAYQQLARITNTGAVLDQASLNSLLGSADVQTQHISALVDAVFAGGYAGVLVDYQGVPVAQRANFSAFLTQLKDALAAKGLQLAVALNAPYLDDNGQWETAGQDWAAIGSLADVLFVQMPPAPDTYGSGGAAEQLLSWATRQVDRRRLVLLLGANAVDMVGEAHFEIPNLATLTNYGQIALEAGSENLAPGQPLSATLSGSAGPLEWDGGAITYKYSYEQAGQTHTVWLANEGALAQHLRLAPAFNVGGVAVRGLDTTANGAGYAAALRSYTDSAEPPAPAAAALVWIIQNAAGDVVHNVTGADALSMSWDGTEAAGDYTLQVDFSLGDNVVTLDSVPLSIAAPVAEVEPTPEPVNEVTGTGAVGGAGMGASVNTSSNFRDGPGLGYPVKKILEVNARLLLIGRNQDASWYQSVPQGEEDEGWVYGSLVTVDSGADVNSLPIVKVDPPVGGGGGGGGPAPAPAPAPAPVKAAPITGGFEVGGQTQSFGNPTLMASSGMTWVKFQHKWSPGDPPDTVAGRISSAHANGFKVLLSIPGASSYPGSIDFQAYVNFLGGVAALGPDAIEVWNEMNIDFEWPAGQIDPASYVNNMLAPAYNAIKAANSRVIVISGAPAPTGFDNGTNAWADSRYMAGVAAAGGANYMDCIGVHHNAGATSPSANSGHPAGNSHYSWYFWPTLNMYYDTFGGARPVCFTELGYLSGQDFGGVPSRFSWAANTTVAQHAQWLAEAASLSASSGKVRLLIVFNVDFTYYADDPQAGYAMVRPDGSCPSCTLLGTVMGR